VARPSVVVALLTPFGSDEHVDLAVLREHVEFLIEAGVDGLMPCGTTGEGPLLEEDEVEAVTEAAVAATGGRVRVLSHAGRASTRATVELARRAIAAGADAVSAVVPYYYDVGDAQVLRHYRALLERAGGTPVYAYTIPARTGNELSPRALRTLAGEGLAGLKDSTKSIERHREYLAAAPAREEFAVFMGSDGLLLEALELGAAGSVSAIANVWPDLLVALTRAFVDGRSDEAKALQQEIAALRAELSEAPALVGLKRAAANQLAENGISYPTTLRAPLG
jgi:4-hydroxy-tetrahydrodipicolinate synthase/2-dehydro-3-deoxy-phosphogluconate/2-dehydro-3-deoxy-6-phosphogalactonate aldolase